MTRVNGQSIEEFIPLDLRREFYQNSDPKYKYSISNGLDPYGFSTDGLVLYLPLWALKDDSFKSIDAYKHTATVTGALWRPDGRFFDGATGNDDEIIVPTVTSLENIFDGGGTVIAWVNAASDGGGDQGNILGKTRWSFVVRGEAAGKVIFQFSQSFTGDDYLAQVSAANGVTLNQNVHVAATYNSDDTSNLVITYIDAVVKPHSNTTPTGTRDSDSGIDLLVGNHPTVARVLDGVIGEIRAYTRILSAAEITHDYNTTVWRYQ